jgi:hypothetical protein
MNLSKLAPRIVLSLVLAGSVFASYSMRPVAVSARSETASVVLAAEASVQEPAAAPASELSGALVSSGLVTINGHPAKNGTTVLSGATVATGSDGNGLIELGALGRVRLRPKTSLVLTFTSAGFVVTPICANAQASVPSGLVEIRSNPPRSLKTAESTAVSRGTELFGNPGTELILDCSTDEPPGGGFITPGVWGVAGLIAISGGIAIGVASGDGRPGPAALSPRVP